VRRIVVCVLGAISLCIFVLPVFAWEFTLNGEFEYRMRYWSRIGQRDLFGNGDAVGTDVIAGFGLPVGLTGPSLWSSGVPVTRAPQADGRDPATVCLVRNGFAEYDSDAHIADMRMTVNLNFKLSEAVYISTQINLGGYRYAFGQTRQLMPTTTGDPFSTTDPRYQILFPGIPPLEEYYMVSTSRGTHNTAAIPSVQKFFAVLRLPVGNLSFGTRRFDIGTGATYGYNDRDDSISLNVPYGPWSFQTFVFPFQQRVGPYRLRNDKTGESLWQAYWQGPDPNQQSQWFVGEVIKLHQGPLELGIGAFSERQHIQDNDNHHPNGSRDYDWYQVLLWMKYFNGRFFLNSEYAWENGDHRVNAQVYEFNYPTYTEGYHLFVETGTIVGPLKLSLVYAQASGPDRGTRDQNPTKIYAAFPINYQALEPYNYLMFHTYGGGPLGNPNRNNYFGNSAHPDGTGQMTDARAFACRIDYALAANLNIWGSYLWAERLERNGYWAGQFGTGTWWAGDQVSIGFPGNERASGAQNWKQLNWGGSAAGYNPYVDDSSIGWEIGTGLDWKILEGVTMSTRYAYWQPGGWFDEAFMAVTNSHFGLQGRGQMFGRSPIHALKTSFFVAF
jgi:hypothetical protein